MGDRDDAVAGLSQYPPIPEQGLTTVLAGWAGRGSLFEALTAPRDEREERQWSSSDIRQRANRVLLAILEPDLERWPRRIAEWLDYLPAAKAHTRTVKRFPFSGVAWAQSRREFGWPPAAFVGKESSRSADMLAVQVLRWCAEELGRIWEGNETGSADFGFGASQQVTTVIGLLQHEPMSHSTPLTPTKADLRALRREGAPWGSVSNVAHILLEAEQSNEFLTHQLLLPDAELRWRLFHLATLGVLLSALRDSNCRITSLRPLSARSGAPNYQIVDPDGIHYFLWFEASGVWQHQSQSSPYMEVTSGLRKAPRSNGADLLLLNPEQSALVIECKYTWNAEVVAREGYYQAMAYGVEARSRLAESVTAVVVGPETVVSGSTFVNVSIGNVGIIPPSELSGIVDKFLHATKA